MKRRLFLCVLMFGCAHSEPFKANPDVPDGPRETALPRRLTYSAGTDQTPAWFPDGASLLYSFQRLEQSDRDDCIGELPAQGGSRSRSYCWRGPSEQDSTNSLEWPTVNSVAALAYLRSSVAVGPLGPTARAVAVATLNSSDTGRVVRELPYIATSGKDYGTVTHLQWLRQGELVFIGAIVANVSQTSQPALVISGLEIARLAVNPAASQPVVVPGTDYASSVCPNADGTSIYYTLGGDSRILQRDLASGTVSVVHDFGTLGIARDVSVRGSHLVAVVGGEIAFDDHPVFGPLQSDGGGTLVHVDLTNDLETELAAPGLVRHPTVSPDGTHVVAEVSVVPGGAPDLWLFETP